MGDFVFNIAKGRVAEFFNRVDSNDPANCALVVIALDTTGLESDAVLKDKDDLAALVSGTTNEATNSGYARVIITDTGLAMPAPDDTNDRMDLPLSNIDMGSPAAGNAWSKLVIGFDPDTTAGTDSSIIPLTCHDFVVTPDGSNIIAVVPAAGFFRAS